MGIPDYQSVMLPLLELANDGRPHSVAEAVETLAHQFKLTDADRKELLPSGQDRLFENRVRWARTYLGKAGLLEAFGRGKFRITDRGRGVLRSKPETLDSRFLGQFTEFQNWRRASRRDAQQADEPVQSTPEEMLEGSYQALRSLLAQELLQRVRSCSPAFFEKLVLDLLVAMGYGGSRQDAARALGRSGDDGVDGLINEDKLGLDIIYIQAKRWNASVGRPIVQAFAGTLEGQSASKGVLITTSQFSQDAREYVDRIHKKIVLIDGEQLVELMIDHGIGVTEIASYSVKKLDLDYFEEDDQAAV